MRRVQLHYSAFAQMLNRSDLLQRLFDPRETLLDQRKMEPQWNRTRREIDRGVLLASHGKGPIEGGAQIVEVRLVRR